MFGQIFTNVKTSAFLKHGITNLLSNISDNNNEKTEKKTREGLFKNMSGNIPGGNFPGGSLIGGNFLGGSFPDTEENTCEEHMVLKYFLIL